MYPPDLDQECMARVRKFHPGWEILFFSDGDARDFVRREAPDYLAVYDWFPRPVMKADMFRVLATCRLGGFYLDTDFWVSHALDPLREHEVVFPWERQMSQSEFERKFPEEWRTNEDLVQVGNYAFGSVPEHPLLNAILDEMVVRTEHVDRKFVSDSDVLYATGPDLITSVIYRDRWYDRDVTILEGDANLEVPPSPRNEFKDQWFRLGAFGTHLMSGVWRGDRK